MSSPATKGVPQRPSTKDAKNLASSGGPNFAAVPDPSKVGATTSNNSQPLSALSSNKEFHSPAPRKTLTGLISTFGRKTTGVGPMMTGGPRKTLTGINAQQQPGDRTQRISFILPRKNSTNFGNRNIADIPKQPDMKNRRKSEMTSVRHRTNLLCENSFPEMFRGIYSLRYSPNGATLATAFGSGGIQVRDPKNAKVLKTLRNCADQGLPIMSVRFNPTHPQTFYAASVCGAVFNCDVESGEFYRCIQEKTEINALDVNVNGDVIVTGSKDSGVRCYNVETNKLLHKYRRPSVDLTENDMPNCHSMRVFAVRFHPQNRDVMATGGWDDTVRIWDIRTKSGCVRTIRGPHITGDAIDIQDNTVMTGSWVVSNSLQLWNLGSGELIETVNPINRPPSLNGEFLYVATFLHGDIYNDLVVVGGSGLDHVEVISLKAKAVVGKFKANKAVLAIDTYENAVAYGGEDLTLRIGDIT